jgi:hypothetical protein
MLGTLIQPLTLAENAQGDGRIPYCRVAACPDDPYDDDLLFRHFLQVDKY